MDGVESDPRASASRDKLTELEKRLRELENELKEKRDFAKTRVRRARAAVPAEKGPQEIFDERCRAPIC